MRYKTFIRSANNFEEFSSAEKEITPECESDLTFKEAMEQCANFNKHRTAAEIAKGTKMEFEEEE